MDDPSPTARQELEFSVVRAVRQSAVAYVPVVANAPVEISYVDEQHISRRLVIQPIPDTNTGTVCFVVAHSLADIRQVSGREQ